MSWLGRVFNHSILCVLFHRKYWNVSSWQVISYTQETRLIQCPKCRVSWEETRRRESYYTGG